MEKKRPSRYFGDLAWTGRSMSLPARCKSEIIVVITSATKQMTRPNCSVTSQYLTYLQSRKGPSCSRLMEHGQLATWVSYLDVSLKSFLLSLVQRN